MMNEKKLDWKEKLSAYLHDSPSKALDIRGHELRSDAANVRAGTAETVFDKTADWAAAAADRIPFPYFRTSGLSCAFDGVHNTFRHPLGGDSTFPFHHAFASTAHAEENEQTTQPAIVPPDDWPQQEKDRAAFIATWRLWRQFAGERDARFALLPADTRIPDHTIWNHCSITSAFSACGDAPALLRFQLGPVQEFIAAARTTRDLWSGSYLISWLMTCGLKALSAQVGPDSVIFPSLYGQPVFDFLWKEEIWSRLTVDGRGSIEQFNPDGAHLTTPNLPNVFLALVPADRATSLANDVQQAISDEWNRIADAVWSYAFHSGSTTANRARFDTQINRHLSIAWQATPFPKTLDEAAVLAQQLPDPAMLDRFQLLRETFEQKMPREHRDRRFYTSDAKDALNNIGLAWSLVAAVNQWQHDAVRQTRNFPGVTGGWDVDAGLRKDALTGVDACVFENKNALKPLPREFFKHDDPVGAVTLVKRLWHLAYLVDKKGMDPSWFKMPNTYDLAQQRPDQDSSDVEAGTREEGKYFAILAFDGDDMGRWVSGEKAPLFRTQLADYVDSNGSRKGALAYFQGEGRDFAAFLDTPRLLNPSYHLQFSEALSNFALHAAPRVIRAHKGRLVYAGGDDVLAMLPADTAIACADDLQRVFSGKAPGIECGIRAEHPGFLTFEGWDRFPALSSRGGNGAIPFLVPGPRATASCGVAIAHFKAPLQDVVRTAQAAEKRAKRKWKAEHLKHALAVTILKHSGEITEWNARFDTDDPHETPMHRRAIPAFKAIQNAMERDVLSAKFPHRLLELVEPYRSHDERDDQPGFPIKEIVRAELATVMSRQRGGQYKDKDARIVADAVSAYLDALPDKPKDVVDALSGLLTTAAFFNRQP